MRKIMLICLFAIAALTANAQKFALLDMEYILKNIPAYERANEQLNQVSKKWQAEVEALNTEASTMYKNYQNEMVFLSAEQKKARQEAIMKKEKDASDLKRKYFGPEGELFKKRESLMSPIQEDIQRCEGDIRLARLLARARQSIRRRHHLRLAKDRHQQRSAAEVGILQLKKILIIKITTKRNNEKAYFNAYVVHAIGNIRTEVRTRKRSGNHAVDA